MGNEKINTNASLLMGYWEAGDTDYDFLFKALKAKGDFSNF